MSTMNLTLLTDLYQLTMMQGYFKNKNNDTVVFDAFYRTNPSGNGFAIAAGLEQVIDYLKNLRFSPEDIEYLRGLIFLMRTSLIIWRNLNLPEVCMQFRKERLYSQRSL